MEMPPPLEDCSEVLKPAREKKAQLLGSRKQAAQAWKKEFMPDSQPAPSTTTTKLKKATVTKQDGHSLTEKGGFGLKAGFLLGAAPPSTAKKQPTTPATTKSRGIQFDVEKKPEDPSKSHLRLEEVQQALKSDLLGKKEWMTAEFMEKLARDPALASLFQGNNTEIQEAIDMFSSNPNEALKRYSHRAEIMNALRAFSGHFGEHLSKMADLQEEVAAKSTAEAEASCAQITPKVQIPADLPEHEKELVRKVMADEKVQDALRDPRVQKILFELKTKPPHEANAMLRTVPADIQEKLACLMRVGLLQVMR